MALAVVKPGLAMAKPKLPFARMMALSIPLLEPLLVLQEVANRLQRDPDRTTKQAEVQVAHR